MFQINDKDDFVLDQSIKLTSLSILDNFNKSFNPIREPADDWTCKFDGSLGLEHRGMDLHSGQPVSCISGIQGASAKGENNFSFLCGPSVSEDDNEVTELKIRAFLDEKYCQALDLKKLQTPLCEEFYNTLNASGPLGVSRSSNDENVTNYLKLPSKSKSPRRASSGTPSPALDAENTASPGICSSVSFSEIQRKWKEELDQELERKREMMRQASVGGKTSSPKDRALNRQRDRLRFASPGK